MDAELLPVKYSDDQPRDDAGRWTSDGGGGGDGGGNGAGEGGGGDSVTLKKGDSQLEDYKNEVDEWESGSRKDEALAALDPSKYDETMVVLDDEGKVAGAAAYWSEPDTANEEGIPDGKYIRIRNMGTRESGYGRTIFNKISNIARSKNAGIYLSSLSESRGFYERLGMNRGIGGTYYLTAGDLGSKSIFLMDAKHNLTRQVLSVAEYVKSLGIVLPADLTANINAIEAILPPELKRRDPREPGRRQKEMLEDKIAARLLRYWRKQAQIVWDRLQAQYPDRKATAPPTYIIDDAFDEADQDALIADLMRILTEAAKNGVDLFKTGVGVNMDYTLVNSRAAAWARDYVYDLVKDIGSTTRRVLQDTISAFVETPGMTMGDVWRSLPFDEARAQMIATTEITRAYASANRIAGKELQKEFPGVRVVKTWFTNNDDLVCDICAPLDGKEIEIDDGFGVESGEAGLDTPPAHPNCRCWMETSTALAELGEEAGAEVGIMDSIEAHPDAKPVSDIVESAPADIQKIIDRMYYEYTDKFTYQAGSAPFRLPDGAYLSYVAQGKKPTANILIHEATHAHQSVLVQTNPKLHDKLMREFAEAAQRDIAEVGKTALWHSSMANNGEEIWAYGSGWLYGGSSGMMETGAPNVTNLLRSIYK